MSLTRDKGKTSTLLEMINGCGAVIVLSLGTLPAGAEPVPGLYGTPGLIDMPTAEMLDDGSVTFGFSRLPDSLRVSAGFQVLPRVNLTFRYSGIGDLGGFVDNRGYALWDRSLDLNVLLWPEGDLRPAVSVGLRDILGTGVLSSEYLVATKRVTPSLSLSAGLGWGRLATGNSIGSIGSRSTGDGGDLGGELRLESLFRGDVGLFGGLRWQAPIDGLSVVLEYSSDDYSAEARYGVETAKDPWSIGINWTPNPSLNLGLAAINGNGLAFNMTAVLDPQGSDLWPKPRWNPPAAQTGSVSEFSGSGVAPLALGKAEHNCTATISAVGVRSAAVAVERTGQALAAQGCATALVRVAREGMVLSETRVDLSGTAPVVVSSAAAAPGTGGATVLEQPSLSWALSPLVRFSLFDPDQPLYHDLSVALQTNYRLAPGLSLSGQVSRTMTGDFDEMTRGRKGSLPAVRTDGILYAREAGPRLDYLALDHFHQHSDHVFSRFSAGYLENMYAGLSGEIYVRHAHLPLAASVEINLVRARDFDQGLGLRDLPGLAEVNGHASLYWDTGFHGLEVQVDVGQYLAGDTGTTLSVSRDFRNGWEIGAFATVTGASAIEFGEGSFDKGVFFRIPVAAFWRSETGQAAETRVSSLTGDGGQRLDIRNRLHEIVTRGDSRSVLAGCQPGAFCFSH